MSRPSRSPSPLARWLYRSLAGLFIALAAIGVALPVVPTTPFLIVAAWAAGKSSPALRRRLRAHPRYGPALVRWQDHGAVSRRAKILAVTLMAASWILIVFTVGKPWLIVLVGLVMASTATYLVTRPETADPATDHR